MSQPQTRKDFSAAPMSQRRSALGWRQYWFLARVILGSRSRLFLDVLRLRRKYAGKIVDRRTQLVVEGFPRCANTFAVSALMVSPGGPRHIASHTHLPAQVVRATKLSVPVIVLIRQPDEATASLILLNPWLTPYICLRYYNAFYSSVWPYLDRCVAATFEQVTTDYASVIRKVNQQFGVNLILEDTPENTQRAFNLIERRAGFQKLGPLQVSMPTVAKARSERRRLLQEECHSGIERRHYEDALGWYHRVKELAHLECVS